MNEVQLQYKNDTDTTYGVLRDEAGLARNVISNTWVTHPSSGSLDSFDISAGTALGGLWIGTFPTGVANGFYIWQQRLRVGGTPNFSDKVKDAVKGYWDGTIFHIGAFADAVWNAVLTGATYNVPASAGRRLRQVSGVTTVDGSINDASATITSFITDLPSDVDNFHIDQLIVFLSGDLTGQCRPVLTYTGATKRITVTALTSIPVDGDEFVMVSTHIHSVEEIAEGVMAAVISNQVTAGSVGKVLRIMEAWIAGNWRVKPTDVDVQQLLDANNGSTVILEQSLSKTSPYRTITVII